MSLPPFQHAAALSTIAPHGFFGRRGGVSVPPFDSLNCGPGSSDEAGAVAENRRRVREAVGATHLLTAHQTHSAAVRFISTPLSGDAPLPYADGLVTSTPGLAVGALAADCTPVLFAAADGQMVGAAHAGWRGSLGGVLEAMVALMLARGATLEGLRCAIGPCLRPPHFQVREDLLANVTAVFPAAKRFFSADTTADHWQYDHVGFVRWRLETAGLCPDHIEDVGGNTLPSGTDYFSYRGARAAGQPDYGRNLSLIRVAAAPSAS